MQTTERTLANWVAEFLLAKRAERRASGTLSFYKEKLKRITKWFTEQGVERPEQLSPENIRAFLVALEERGRSAGGVHSFYRALSAFVRWWANEVEPEKWRDPLKKVRPPKVPENVLSPVELDTVQELLRACNTRRQVRNRAVIYLLIDTGMRASELTALCADDVDEVAGVLLIRQGKGGKSRQVFLGKNARRAIRAYLRERGRQSGALFQSEHGGHLGYKGLREIIQQTAKRARVEPPPLHAFRRGFALECLRGGMDVLTLSRLLGHTNLKTTLRYLKMTSDDLREAHARTSPADKIR